MLNTTIEMGLVRIPVKVYAATGTHDRQLRQFHVTDAGRIRYEKVCELDDKPVNADDIRKGVEDRDGHVVLLDDSDLESLPVRSSKHVDVLGFVPERAIDPIYYDKAYYLGPGGADGVDPYLVLRDAMIEKGLVALVTITLRQRESLAVIRPHGKVLVLDRLLWADEVRAPELTGADAKVDQEELAMAHMLIDMRSGDWDPEQYADEYQAALDELIEAKAAGREAPKIEPESRPKVTSIMDALQKSIEQGTPDRPPPATARKATAKKATKKATRKPTAKKSVKAAARKRTPPA